MRQKRDTLAARFDAKWTPEPYSGCWLWTAKSEIAGYGSLMTGSKIDRTKRSEQAHRVAWQLYRGLIPAEMFVLHHCDTRSCVNPDHLFLGTQKDNVIDMDSKGRRNVLRGVQCGRCKLTVEQVHSIRKEFGSQREIGRKYGISHTQVEYIQNRKSWSWLP